MIDSSVVDTAVKSRSYRSKVIGSVSFGRSEYLTWYFVLPDSGPLPLVLYSHQQVLDKLAVLKDNVLYCEPITAELEVPKKKSKSGKSGKVKSSGSAQPTASTSSSTSRRRPSDPESADKDVVFPDPDQPSVLSTIVDVHAELYNLPSFQFLHQLLEYLYSEHGLLLRPVSNILLSFAVIVFLLWGFGWGFTGRWYRIMWSLGPKY